MTLFFFLIFGLSVFHFIYEGIVAPSLRLGLRFQIFEIRDRLREMQSDDTRCANKEVFDLIHDRLNSSLRMLHAIHISTLVEFKMELDSNEELRTTIARKEAVMKGFVPAEAKEIDKTGCKIVGKALSVNTGGFFIYAVPLILAIVCLDKITHIIKAMLMIPPKDIAGSLNLPAENIAIN